MIRRMCDTLKHRGPDAFGEYVHGNIALGMRRLSIIDLDTGQQPIANEDESHWIVFNGEIYNYRELRKDLQSRGHLLRTHTDTEVILHLYEELGESCVERLRGMFAFAIWDTRRQALVLARDRLGIKPLYFAHLPDALLFASEIKALLAHPEVQRELCPEALFEYFTHLCVPGHLSIFRRISKLAPGQVMTIRGGQVSIRQYWDATPAPVEDRSPDLWIEELRSHLEDAVSSHMVADVPIGAFLSGGLDSGTMVALMSRSATAPVRTFTIGFSFPEGSFDERMPARQVAERYETLHNECLLESEISEVFPALVRTFDEPFADSSAIPNWLICRETSRQVKVALSGLGGDELFGGYERYVGFRMAEGYRRTPSVFRSLVRTLASCLPAGNGSSYHLDRFKRFATFADLPPLERYRCFLAAFKDPAEILHPDLHESARPQHARYQEIVQGLRIHDPLDLPLFADLRLYLPDDLLTLTDRVSMAHSLEVRVPYLDHKLVEFVARMPASLKVRGHQKKYLFRRAVAPWVPHTHLSRVKQGFSIPLASWFRGSLRTLLTDLVGTQACRESPWLNWMAVKRLVDEHLSGRQNHENRLWALLCFLEWERQYVREIPSPALDQLRDAATSSM
jgi:asparagine synthase (glutamine-hydrolysing)